MTLTQRIESLIYIGKYLSQTTDEMNAVKRKAEIENAWFTQQSIDQAIDGIKLWLTPEALTAWTSKYRIGETIPKRIGMILAGNIPMVGFHDILSCYLSGNISVIRFSEKDNVLITHLLNVLTDAFPEAERYFDFGENFKTIDRLIATGSDSSANLFRKYFSHLPSLIRCHRNAVAVLTGNETDEDLLALGEDVFMFFGLGCRNVSKLFVPKGYSFDHLLGLWHEKYKELVLNDKYKNNFDYLYAIYLLNKEHFYANGHVILRESAELSSPVASLFYEYYDTLEDLALRLQSVSGALQVVVSATSIPGLESVLPGNAQKPAVDDYADGVDTMEFLLN